MQLGSQAVLWLLKIQTPKRRKGQKEFLSLPLEEGDPAHTSYGEGPQPTLYRGNYCKKQFANESKERGTKRKKGLARLEVKL
jgi:hypothetical protein